MIPDELRIDDTLYCGRIMKDDGSCEVIEDVILPWQRITVLFRLCIHLSQIDAEMRLSFLPNYHDR